MNTTHFRTLLILLSLSSAAALPLCLTGCSNAGKAGELMCKEHGVPERLCTLCHPEIKDNPAILKCAEHDNIPEELCTLCHPELKAKYKTCPHGLPTAFCKQCNRTDAALPVNQWCLVHGLPRALCIRCEPGLAKSLPMCAEHKVPAAACTICRPELAVNFVTCRRHGLPASLCNDAACQGDKPPLRTPERVPPTEPATLPDVRLAGADVAEKAGIQAAPVYPAALAPTLLASGEVGYDETRLVRVSARTTGVIRSAPVRLGHVVSAGQVLATVDSAELGQAKADYLAARSLVDLWTQARARQEGLGQEGIMAGRQLLDVRVETQRAETDLLKSIQRLRTFGCDDRQLEQLPAEADARRCLLTIVAPADGTVVSHRAVVGAAVELASELFSIADVSRMWLRLDVFEKDLRRISVGQPVAFRVPGLEAVEFTGQVAAIDAAVNERTRTLRVRVDVENHRGLLRANMFGRAEIRLAPPGSAWRVPREAVQWADASQVVFVQKTAEHYQPRRVLTAALDGQSIELAWANLAPGDWVVTTGAFLLKTELQKGSIGAGCCGE